MPSKTTVTVALLSLVLAWAPIDASRASTLDSPGPASGEVSISSLPGSGVWTNTPKSFKKLSDDSLSITASKETDLYKNVDDGARVMSAPMLLFPADSTFVLTAAVRADFKKEFDGGFLVVYADPDHWLKLLFEKSHYGTYSVCSNVTNVDVDDTVNGDVASTEVYLRITRAKDVFGFYYSVDGTKWTYIRYFTFPVREPLKIGFGSQSPTGDECATVFSKIRYSTRAVGDFWSGEPEQGAPKD
jgi:uncharacterized protein